MRWGRLHAGVDIAAPTGTPIRASAGGTVAIAGWVGGYGNYTCIQHGGGIATCYGHQTSIGVHVGQHVRQGQVIGTVGCTGHCFGPHVHFEVRVNGTPVDPMGYCSREAAGGSRETVDGRRSGLRTADCGLPTADCRLRLAIIQPDAA